MAVELSSEESVSACESLLAKGKERSCTLWFSDCMWMVYRTGQPNPDVTLYMNPWQCRDALPPDHAWMANEQTGGPVGKIPVRPPTSP